MNIINEPNPTGVGEISTYTDVPDGTYGSFLLVMRVTFKDGRVVAIEPDGVDYSFGHAVKGDNLVLNVCGIEKKSHSVPELAAAGACFCMITAHDQFGQIKSISALDAEVGRSEFATLVRRLESAPADDPYGAAFAVWVGLTDGLLRAGLPAEQLFDQAMRIAAQNGCAGSA